MNKTAIFNHFSAIIDNMIDRSSFFKMYFQNPDSFEESIIGDMTDDAIPANLAMMFGASRACIVDEYSDYVVKFDVNSDEKYDSLSEREEEVYQAACENGLEKYFAECEYIGNYTKTFDFYDVYRIYNAFSWCGYDPEDFEEKIQKYADELGEIKTITVSVPLYAYPRAHDYHYTLLAQDEEKKMERIVSSMRSPLKNRNLAIAIEFVHKYGFDEYARLTEFMYNYDINDLHMGNIMGINGDMVLIDYAGFHSDWSEESSDCHVESEEEE